MTAYRSPTEADLSFDAGELTREDAPGGTITLDIGGASGADGRRGSSGSTGSSGSYNSDGTRGPGGRGGDGSPGTHGHDGTHARSERIELVAHGAEVLLVHGNTRERIHHPIVVRACGGDGGRGGAGGSGGSGGSGSPSGSSGSDGRGGDGGDGGNGGHVEVSVGHPHLFGFIAAIDTSGGRAGAGGSGSPPGRSGRPGDPGSHVMRCNEAQGARFGLVVRSISLAHDGTACGGNLARGSTLSLNDVQLANAGDFDVPAPFAVRVTVDAGLRVTDATIVNLERSLSPRHGQTIPSGARVTVDEGAEVGRYKVTLATASETFGEAALLDEGRRPTSFLVPVNHRVPTEALAGLAPDQEREARALLEGAHAMPPETQSPFFLAALVASFAPPEGLTEKQKAALAPGLGGALLEPERLFGSMDTLRGRSAAACEAIGADFVRHLRMASRIKALDLVLTLLTEDRVLSADEKARMLAVAKDIGVEETWLHDNVPQLYAPGDTKVGGGGSMRLGAALVPFVCAAFAYGATAVLGPMGSLRVVGCTIALAALVALPVAYAVHFRVACPSCGSTRIEPAPQGAGALVGEEDDLRCTECGTRGTRTRGARAEVLHSDTRFADAKAHVATRLAPLPVLAAAAAAFRVSQGGPLPHTSLIGAIVVAVTMGLSTVGLLRARRFPSYVLVLAILAALAFLVFGND